MSLNNREPWRYFEDPATPNDEAAALLLLRGMMGSSYASNPTDTELKKLLKRSVRFVEAACGQFFVRRDGTLSLHGNDAARLFLPFPVINASQTGAALTTAILDVDIKLWDNTTSEDTTLYTVNDGAWEGDDDPRRNPFIEFSDNGYPTTFVSRPPEVNYYSRVWPYGVRNIHVTGSWGYLDEDGDIPPGIQYALARLCVLNDVSLDNSCAVNDKKRGAVVSESVQGRSYVFAAHAVSYGLTLDWDVDQALRRFRAPPRAIISRPPRRQGRSIYY